MTCPHEGVQSSQRALLALEQELQPHERSTILQCYFRPGPRGRTVQPPHMAAMVSWRPELRDESGCAAYVGTPWRHVVLVTPCEEAKHHPELSGSTSSREQGIIQKVGGRQPKCEAIFLLGRHTSTGVSGCRRSLEVGQAMFQIWHIASISGTGFDVVSHESEAKFQLEVCKSRWSLRLRWRLPRCPAFSKTGFKRQALNHVVVDGQVRP